MENFNFLVDETTSFSFSKFGVNFVLCAISSFALRKVYISRSISLSGKFHIGTVIPILALVTFLVIMIVKSSLTLSLGLVGALSVVRFRTPIKEPEELVYLFLSIALGLGYGANQTLQTTVCFAAILLVIWMWLSRTPTNLRDEYNLLINWTNNDLTVKDITKALTESGSSGDLLKYSTDQQSNSVFIKILIAEIDEIESIKTRIQTLDSAATLSFYEARPLQ